MAISLKSNLIVLIAQKAQAEKRRITLRSLADELDLNRTMIYAIANDTAKHYPKTVLEALCAYFGCSLDSLFTVEPAEDGAAGGD